MNKTIALALTALLLLTCAIPALAEGRTPPEDKKVITTTDVVGAETMFRKYDNKFYEAASEQPGTVVRLDYTTTAYGAEQPGWVNIYLPYGYDENGTERYNIIYFLHGTNETQSSLIGDEKVKNAIDNMIEVGIVKPFIMVCPTYYCDYETRAIDMTAFSQKEMRNDIMPAVESAYRTYAETADEAGFIASRDHRAFCGYSRGCYACWHQFFNNLDLARWFMPFSANISGPAEMTLAMPVEEQMDMIKDALAAQADYKDDFFIYAACGGKRDDMYAVMQDLISAMIADTDDFSFGTDPAVNNLYYSISNEIHQTLMTRFYLYNAFDVVFM
jgi:endo-1,4-beta-xylanase